MPYIEIVCAKREDGMLRQTTTEETTYPAQSFTSQYIPVPRKDEMSEAHVEDYLDHFCVPLVGKISYEERVKMREELRSQIESVIAAYVELGSPREQAIALTLQQFSHVPAVAPVVPVMAQPPVQTNYSVPQQTQVSARPKGAFLSFSVFGLATILQLITLVSFGRSDSGAGMFGLLMIASYPVAAGLTLGYRRPDRPLRTLLRSLAWLALPTLVATGIATSETTNSMSATFAFTTMLLCGNLIFGGFGAKVGTWMRQSGVIDKIDPPFPARVDNGPYRLP